MNEPREQFAAAYARNNNNAQKTADELGVPATTLKSWPEYKARGEAPMRVIGRSTLRDRDGNVVAEWEKTAAGEIDRAEAIESIRAALESIKGLAPYVPPPALTNDKLLAVYPIGDHHHGMKADAKETGDNYDCDISTQLLTSAVDVLCESAPAADEALLLDLGDFTHANDQTNETPGHRNRLDVDTRHENVIESGAWAMIHCTLRLLEKHRLVRVWIMPGNHNPDAYFALALAISMYFHNEPRVEVDMRRGLYKYLRFGKNLIASHHGHGAKIADLPLLMAVDRPEDWAATSHRVWHCGHIHHKTVKEHPGVDVETHRTLAGTDAWHAGKGYRSKRDMSVIVYHADYGEIQRTRFDLAMLAA